MEKILPKVLDYLLLVEYNLPNNTGNEVIYLGFTLKQARQYAGYTQVEMAEILGISRDVYRKLEQSPEKTSIELAKKFSAAVGIGIDQIFFANTST